MLSNKSDLTSLRAINFEEAEEFVNKLGGIYIETSAENNNNIQSVFNFDKNCGI